MFSIIVKSNPIIHFQARILTSTKPEIPYVRNRMDISIFHYNNIIPAIRGILFCSNTRPCDEKKKIELLSLRSSVGITFHGTNAGILYRTIIIIIVTGTHNIILHC